MKRGLAVLAAMLLAVVAAVAAYQATVRERQYRLLLEGGDAALGESQTFGAIEAYSGAIALHPESMLAHLRRGETYRLRGDLDDAARDFRRASTLDPAATRPLDELGDVLYQRGRFDRAAEVYQRRLQLDERSAEVLYRLALARYRLGEIDPALTALSASLRLSDTDPEVQYLLGLCQRAKNRPADALAAFERTVSLSPGHIAAREELADLYRLGGRSADELDQLQTLAGLDRARPERHVAIGLAHARAGQWDLAVLTLRSALERTPDEPLIYGALGQVWLQMAEQRRDRPDALGKALEALGRVASTPAATSEILTRYGRALALANQPDAAEHMLQKATVLYPVDPEAFHEYALVSDRLGHLPAARTALIQFDALVPEDAEASDRAYQIGDWSLRLHDAPAATTWLRRAGKAGVDAALLSSIAEAQMRAGDRQGAIVTIGKAVLRDPQNARLAATARRIAAGASR